MVDGFYWHDDAIRDLETIALKERLTERQVFEAMQACDRLKTRG